MKKIIATCFVISLLPSVAAVAQIKPSQTAVIKTSNSAAVFVKPFCRFSLQFLASTVSKDSNHAGSGGVAITQVMGKDGKPMPCTEDN